MFVGPLLENQGKILVFFCLVPSSNMLQVITQLAGLQSMAGNFGNCGIKNGSTTISRLANLERPKAALELHLEISSRVIKTDRPWFSGSANLGAAAPVLSWASSKARTTSPKS